MNRRLTLLTEATGSGAPASAPADEKLLRRAPMAGYVLLAIALAMVHWFILALQGQDTAGPQVPLPSWWLDAAALSPLVVLIRFRRPDIWKRSGTLEFDLRVISGIYLLMALLGATLGGYWQLWPGVVISIAVQAGVSYVNWRAREGSTGPKHAWP
ncbi:hypothetical protein ACIQNU_20800 [Streptomyces sp. NPDC091292]|uniref:hypothetical protein n=1 Tax=Streptomyces sp. NPDC091292 TaxID=3365991 RepID=UPI0037F687A2